jgi:hypothetical protein
MHLVTENGLGIGVEVIETGALGRVLGDLRLRVIEPDPTDG